MGLFNFRTGMVSTKGVRIFMINRAICSNAAARNIFEPQCQENVPLDMCAQSRLRSAYAFALSDQNLHWAHFG